MYLLNEQLAFPDPNFAGPEGLLAVGGDLSIQRLLFAYSLGIFPWFNEGEQPLWWSPDPRYVIFPDQIHISKTMRKLFAQKHFTITYDQDFERIMMACGETERPDQEGSTWISDAMLEAYTHLHRLGFAHSVEVWHKGALVGGLYGVSLGRCFFGESMFSWHDNASKAGLIQLAADLAARNFYLIDCQMPTDHLKSLGAQGIPRQQFLDYLHKNQNHLHFRGYWRNFKQFPIRK